MSLSDELGRQINIEQSGQPAQGTGERMIKVYGRQISTDCIGKVRVVLAGWHAVNPTTRSATEERRARKQHTLMPRRRLFDLDIEFD